MNKIERIAMVRAMETICRNLNDEEGILDWLQIGIADGDIGPDTQDEDLEYYIEDDNFADLMDSFAAIMTNYARRDHMTNWGQFYCDGVLSQPKD